MTEQQETYEEENYEDPLDEGGEDKLRAGMYKGRAVAGSGSEDAWGGTDAAPQVAIDIDLPEAGRRVTSYLSFHPNAREFSVARLKACGWDGSADLPFRGIDKNAVTVEIKYERYNGKVSMRAEIKTLGRFKHALEPSRARSFMAELAKGAAVVDSAPGATPRPAARQGSAPAGNGYPADWDKPGDARPSTGKVDL